MGEELKTIIAQKVSMAFEGWEQVKGDPIIHKSITELSRAEGREAGRYYDAGHKIAAAMPLAISIDNYLHAHAENKELTWVGKLGISASILESERKSLLHTSRDDLHYADISSTWYNVFFKMLTEGAQRPHLDHLFDNVSFITLNYDRCIEHFLVNSIRTYFDITHSESALLLKQLRIEHPYGQVGKLPWQDPSNRTDFGSNIHNSELAGVATQIRTFTERIEDSLMVTRMRSLLEEAEVVVYLGFSFGDMNMNLLSVPQSNAKEVYGTAYGVSEANAGIAARQIRTSLGKLTKWPVTLSNLTCGEFLSAYWKPILLPRM